MSMTASHQTARSFTKRCTNITRFLLLLVLGLSVRVVYAQTIELKLIDGRNGHPIANKCIYIAVGDNSKPQSGSLLSTQTDVDGAVALQLMDEDLNVNNVSRKLACGLSGVINPAVKYGDTVYIRTGYVLCQQHEPGSSWLAMTNYSTKQVLQHGIATANTCGKVTAPPKPGELIVFVRPLTWWEKLKK